VHVDVVLTALGSSHHPLAADFADFVRTHGDTALRRDGRPEHLTASCFVLSPDHRQVLLCLHRKGGFWVQFGGHLEPDDVDLAAAARRETREESGIADLELVDTGIADLDRHALHDGFACAAHRDVGFVAEVDPAAATVVSDESDDVRWFAVDALPSPLADGFAARLAAVLADHTGDRDRLAGHHAAPAT